MLLKELFDTKVNYKVIEDSKKQFRTQAEIGSKIIIFTAYEDYGNGTWDVSFNHRSKDSAKLSMTYGMSNDNHQLEVLSFIKQSMLEFIARYQPEEIVFTADKENAQDTKNSRARIYKKMLKDVESQGYSLYLLDLGKEAIHFSLTKI